MKVTIFLLTALIGNLALADVCAWMSKAHAEQGLAYLTPGIKLEMTYANQPTATVVTASVKKVSGEYFEISVNGEAIDLGHTNIRINENVSLNIARLIGCEADSGDPDVVIIAPIDDSSAQQQQK